VHVRSSFTPEAIARAAQRLSVDTATVLAVASVESSGNGFLPDGRPKILFERHKFAALTAHRFDGSHPDISNGVPGGYVGGAGEYLRLYRALQLEPEAAPQACSWGAFQILGMNWEACGERSLFGFLLAMHHDADAHLDLFVAFVLGKGLAKHLHARNWAAFAAGYNGPAYERNDYDTKLADAYARAVRA
jgi:hypothetical protein